MIKFLLLIFATTLGICLSFQAAKAINVARFNYPLIDSVGDSLGAFIPKDWEILKLVEADFDGDKATDFVVVIQHRHPAIIEVDKGRESKAHPRILIMAVQDKRKKFYRLVEQSNTFILSPEVGKKDPFIDMRAERGLLKMVFFNPGLENTDTHVSATYTFRFELARFYLFGADYQIESKKNGAYEDYNFHFLNSKVAIRKGQEDVGDEWVQWKLLPRQMLQNLGTFRNPFSWPVLDGLKI